MNEMHCNFAVPVKKLGGWSNLQENLNPLYSGNCIKNVHDFKILQILSALSNSNMLG